jgi:hypothetical protein
MTLKEYASAIRHHDWTACMSDSYAVTRRADARKAELKDLREKSKNHARLWELGCRWHSNFTWSSPSEKWPEDERYEKGWRWVGAYCWAHGLKLTEDEAKALTTAPGTLDEYGRHLTGHPNWTEIDKRIKALEVK